MARMSEGEWPSSGWLQCDPNLLRLPVCLPKIVSVILVILFTLMFVPVFIFHITLV